jgi:NAD(P)-dependent dehydrogenase (short-subunit alcohol dehydrogenase family)
MSTRDYSLAGKVALVTGGRRGIGKTIALAFAEAGADVSACDVVVDDGQLDGVASEIRRLGRRSLAIHADTSRKIDVDHMVNKVMDEFGVIDILVNCAGIGIAGRLMDLKEDEWDRVINVNLKGYYLCSQAVGIRMVERKQGNILSIASQYAFKAAPDLGVYSIAKAGVVMLTRVLARELGSYGIRANAIAPGLVRTELSRHDWADPEIRAQREAAIPLGRLSETDDLAGLALFLASDASSYITGHTVLADGGELA